MRQVDPPPRFLALGSWRHLKIDHRTVHAVPNPTMHDGARGARWGTFASGGRVPSSGSMHRRGDPSGPPGRRGWAFCERGGDGRGRWGRAICDFSPSPPRARPPNPNPISPLMARRAAPRAYVYIFVSLSLCACVCVCEYILPYICVSIYIAVYISV
jgi:hypothetical protein